MLKYDLLTAGPAEKIGTTLIAIALSAFRLRSNPNPLVRQELREYGEEPSFFGVFLHSNHFGLKAFLWHGDIYSYPYTASIGGIGSKDAKGGSLLTIDVQSSTKEAEDDFVSGTISIPDSVKYMSKLDPSR